MKTETLEKQLESVLDDYSVLAAQSKYDDFSDLRARDIQSVVSRMVAAVYRVTGPNSSYSSDIVRILKEKQHLHLQHPLIAGIGNALLSDLQAGYTETLIEQLHADTFANFLEMAQHLADAKFKDAAAVIAGSALEAHLRAACEKVSIDVEVQKSDGTLVPKKADTLNADLAKASFYSKLDQKSVTAWLGLRNSAAHGKYDEYEHSQVVQMIAGIREFISRNPA